MNHAKNRSIWLVILAVLFVLTVPATAPALITASGDVDPEDPNTWTNSTFAYIGYTDTTAPGQIEVNSGSSLLSGSTYLGYGSDTAGTITVTGENSIWTNSSKLYVGDKGDGTLTITNGGAVSNTSSLIGNYPGSTGAVMVDGAGSTWTNSFDLRIGFGGDGILTIAGGGAVSVADTTWVGSANGSTNTIHFGTNGGTLTTESIYFSASQLTGTGTINTQGIVSDTDIVLDGSSGSASIFTIDIASQDGGQVTVNLNLSDTVGSLGAGYRENGSLTIQNGAEVDSEYGYIGYCSGSTGAVTVDGAGSWTNNYLRVGYEGNGTLVITGGGSVSNRGGDIGRYFDSAGAVTVDGDGSTWANSSYLCIGNEGDGTLTITGGGAVSNASSSYIGLDSVSTGVVTVDGDGSTWINSSDLYVGNSGDGTLVITNGSSVSVVGTTYVGYEDGSTGAIHFGTNGGTLLTETIYVSASQLSGTGTINTQGIVGDVNMVLDGSNSSASSFAVAVPSQDGGQVTLNLDLSNTVENLGVGYRENGSLTIQNGAEVHSKIGDVGYNSGSTGEAMVDGTDSIWTNNHLYIGHYGNGTMTITAGGTVDNMFGYIGRYSGSTGEVTVEGSGSTWANGSYLKVGHAGDGTLTITDGGLVSVAGALYIDYDGDNDNDSFINMSTGGMLAIYGDADDSLDDFLGLIDGTDAIQYWDGDSWEALTGAVSGTDYWLTYYSDGDLDGYTVLTVGTAVPEPSMIALLATVLGGFLVYACRKRR